jgi:hypothetical protein
MITLKLGETDATEVVLRSESSQQALSNLSGLGLALAKPPQAKADEIAAFATPVPEKTVCFYSDGRKMERWNLLICSLPLALVPGLGYYVLFTGAPQWSAAAVMLTGLIVFGVAGCLMEKHMLKAFACPGCQAAIEDWDTDEKHRVLIHCARCGSKWDIEYQLRPGANPLQAKRRRPSEFSILCSPRGAY